MSLMPWHVATMGNIYIDNFFNNFSESEIKQSEQQAIIVISSDFISLQHLFQHYYFFLKQKIERCVDESMTYFFALVQITFQDLLFGEIPWFFFSMAAIISTLINVNARATMVHMDIW